MSLHWNYCGQGTTIKTKKSPSSTTLSSQLFLSNHHQSCRCGLHHSIIKPVLLSVCNQTILSDLQATRRSGSIERSCVIIPSEFLVLFTRSRPRIWRLDGTEPELRVYLGSHRRIRCSVHTRELTCSHSQIFTRIAKQKQEEFWEVLNLLLHWRIGCSFVNWFKTSKLKLQIHNQNLHLLSLFQTSGCLYLYWL